jgi:uncharacterized membrane protein
MSKVRSEMNGRGGARDQDAKKALVLGTEKKKRFPLLITIITGSLIAVVAGALFLRGAGETSSLVASGDKVTYPAAIFDDGKAKYYKLKTSDGILIKFFALKSSDGVIRAAFDACDVCWKAGLGYYQEGDFMVCRNCGQRFASVKVNVVTGGCNPVALRREVVDGQVIIKVKDILEGKPYFTLSNRS